MSQTERQAEERRDKRAERRAHAARNDEWRGFIDVPLSAADKAALKADEAGFADTWDGLIDRLMQGYKLSLMYDHRNSTWIASYTCKKSADPNNGYTLTGRGSEWTKAVACLVYKDKVLLAGEWTEYAANGDKRLPDEYG